MPENWGDVLNAQLTTTKFRSVSSMGYYFSAMAGQSRWEYVYNTGEKLHTAF